MNTLNVVESIFFAALDKDTPQARAAYLDEACTGDANLRRCVERLLNAHGKADAVVPARAPGLETLAPPAIEERPGSVIGPYKLLERLGEGGFGVVFMAQQEEPVRRKVALKIIKPGMDSKQVVARFEAERQALALMDHPNIARVLDGGATDSGRPYFVMELVKGAPITEFCDQCRLTPHARLELFVQVCNAVQHAHQKGVIHRDIKPSNVLVTMYDDKPVPKVIDFGVAKAVEQKLTERTMFTGVGQVIGTLEYMSPEQASLSALDVDTRSDVYALGVLLYELLTGATPLDKNRLQGMAFLEMLRLIREEEPPKPSTRLSQSREALAYIAAYRNSDSQKLPGQVRGELDWITMKALEKDRARRYGGASALAADVQRYLKDEQVEACPPTLGYRLKKYVRKHKASLGAAAAIIALLLIGIIATSWQAMRATEAEGLATERLGLALTNEENARKSETTAKLEREKAVRERDAANAARERVRKTLYVSDMNLVQEAWDADDTPRVAELLRRQMPHEGESDLRGLEWHFWDRQCNQHERELEVLSSGALGRGAAFSGDGSRLAVVRVLTNEKRIRPSKFRGFELAVIDTASGKTILQTEFPRGGALAQVMMSRDGKRILTWERDAGDPAVFGGGARPKFATGPLIVWDAGDGKQLLVVKENVRAAVISADGGRIAIAVNEAGARTPTPHAVVVWDVAAGKVLATMEKGDETAPFPCLDFSPDGARLAANGIGFARIWDAATGKELMNHRFGATPTACVFSPDGNRLAVAAVFSPSDKLFAVARTSLVGPRFSLVFICSASDGKELLAIPAGAVSPSLCFSPEGDRLAGWDGGSGRTVGKPTVQVWNAKNGLPLQTIKAPAPVHPVAFSGDGARLLTLSSRSLVQVWPAAPIPRGPSYRLMEPSPDGTRYAVFRPFDSKEKNGSAVVVRDWDDAAVARFESHNEPVLAVRFSGDGRVVASLSVDGGGIGTVHVWESGTGKPRSRVTFETEPKFLTARPVVTLSGDGARLALLDKHGVAKVIDTATGKDVFVAPVEAGGILLGADGRRLVTNLAGPRFGLTSTKVWNVDTGKEQVLEENVRVAVLALSPVGDKLLGVVLREEPPLSALKVWDAPSGRELAALPLADLSAAPPGKTFAGAVAPHLAVFSPDGKRLALVMPAPAGPSRGEDITLIEVDDLKVSGRLEGHTERLSRVVFSPDGKRLASCTTGPTTLSGEMRFWDVETNREIFHVKDVGPLSHLLFDRAGHRLIGLRYFRPELPEPIVIWDGRPRPSPAGAK